MGLIKFTPLIILLLILYLIIPNCESYKAKNDKGPLIRFLIREDTKYSTDYDERKFKKIKMGMSVRQVISSLGLPLAVFKPYEFSKKHIDRKDYISFAYTKSQAGKNYRIRTVTFKDTIVIKTKSSFYID